MENTTWKDRPATLKGEALNDLESLLELCNSAEDLDWVTVILHGGEPLLYKEAPLSELCELVSRTLTKKKYQISLTTNAVLINDLWISIFGRYNIAVAISMDGPAAYHDMYRVDKKQNGTYEEVLAGTQKMILAARQGRCLPPSAIAVVNAEFDGAIVYNHLVSVGFKTVTFILPDGLSGSSTSERDRGLTNYLIGAFGAWSTFNRATRAKVSNFQRIMGRALREIEGSIADPVEHFAISMDSSGGIGLSDVLKSVAPNEWISTRVDGKKSIWEIHDYLVDHSRITATKDVERCAHCDIFSLCGGGVAEERYNKENRYNNPSVHCGVYKRFIPHILNALQ
ncbi:arylsulfatase regulator [Asaia krungthepensis NRIC 0535]|uniref:Arylsulfatase regulator n=2 Tax=Asaia krungthepensis TaxID=220990 RepID=A0ABQ0Q4F8_9PROT|nr:arylsulfatase regulator [Asaia krungthepensis NRIC 0535]